MAQIVMEDFEERYELLLKYMLPSANKCIDKIAFDGFGSDFEFEGKIPKIRIQLKDSCKDLKGIDKLGLYGDVAGKLTDIHFTFFEDHNLSVDISKGYMDIVPFI